MTIYNIIAGSYRQTLTTQVTVTLTSGTTWTVPANWNSSNNFVECIGGGAGGLQNGAAGVNYGGPGGGGGAYARGNNITLTAGASVPISIGAGGTQGVSGSDTSFNSGAVLAKGGSVGSGTTGGIGGLTATSVGSIKFAGGNGGAGSATINSGGGGGGGAAGNTSSGVSGAGGAAPTGGAGGAGGTVESPAGGAGGVTSDGGAGKNTIITTASLNQSTLLATYYTQSAVTTPTTEAGLDALFNTATSSPVVTLGGSFLHTTIINWSSTAPAAGAGGATGAKPTYLPAEQFSWKVEGYILAPTTGTYSFAVDGDDAVDVFVNGVNVANYYGGHGFASAWQIGTGTGTISLNAGQYYTFRARHQEGSGGDGIQVGWKKPGDASYSIIPADNFYSYASIGYGGGGGGGSSAPYTSGDSTIYPSGGNGGLYGGGGGGASGQAGQCAGAAGKIVITYIVNS